MAAVRVDRWLCAARIFKSRALAQEACVAGHVKVDGKAVRPSHPVTLGSEVEAQAPRGLLVLTVLALADKRLSAPLAAQLYEDHSPPPIPRENKVLPRERGAGRPTKADRRALDWVRGASD